MPKSYFFSFLFFSFCSVSWLFAQSINTDSNFYYSSVQNIISLYHKSIGENSRLYNGAEYIEEHPGVSGSPYWSSNLLQTGSIYYDGVFYPKISLAYDVAKEEVVIRNEQQLSIKLIPEKIGFLTLSSQLFIRTESDSTGNPGLKPGLYNIIYKGAIIVLAKRKKTALRKLQPTDHYEFGELDSYFIKKDGNYYAVDNKSSLLNALRDKKEEIKKFLHKNRLNLRRDLENAIIKTADFYSLSKK